jgi:hypothetical protein
MVGAAFGLSVSLLLRAHGREGGRLQRHFGGWSASRRIGISAFHVIAGILHNSMSRS